MFYVVLFAGAIVGMYIEAAYAQYLGKGRNTAHLFGLPTILLIMGLLLCLVSYWVS